MAKRSAIRVALDLETTGLHPEQDVILEIAAVKFQGTEVLETFETFVAPGRSIPYRVQRLTGIKPEHLVGAPSFASISRKLQAFLGDYPIVGHSIPFDVSFLRLRGLARTNPLVDTFELATVLLPSLLSYNLGQVAESLGVRVPVDRHRAMVDTVLAMEVFQALHKRLQSIDLDLLNDLANLDAPRSWPLLHFFRQELRDRQEQEGVIGKLARGSVGDRFAAQLGMDPHILSFAVGREATQQSLVTPLPDTSLLPSDVPPPEVPLPPGYQAARSAVLSSLEDRVPLLLQVTTGGHNYVPALLPALEWLIEEDTNGAEEQKSPRRLVIACANQQSARDLIETILPSLQASLRSKLPVAYLAERGGYLCTHRWFGAAMRRTSGELTAEQARGLAKLRLWTHQTLHGERSELTLLQQEMSAWERISSGYERITTAGARAESSYQRCTYRRKGYCFVSLAEDRVKAACIVVTTHNGLFDDLSSSHSLLSEIDRRIILDADLLAEEGPRWGTSEFEQNHLLRIVNTIGAELPDGRYQGLLALAAPSLRENGPGGLSTTPTIAKAELDTHLLQWFQSLRQAKSAIEKLFLSFHNLIEEFVQQSGRDKGRGNQNRNHERIDQPLRLISNMRNLSTWSETEQAWKQVTQRLRTVISLANEAEKTILVAQRGRRGFAGGSGEENSVAFELATAASQLSEQLKIAEQAMSLTENDHVYWLRMPPPPPAPQGGRRNNEAHPTVHTEQVPALHSQLIQTSTLLKRLVLKDNISTIFVGTALAVDGSFAFACNQLGLENEMVATASLMTEHNEQTLLYLPNDVPEPNSPQYQRHLDETLINLVSALDGQVVALFTSHAALRSTYTAIKPLLETRNILVLGQGVDGSPRQLWQVFQSQERVVLLGTGTFWDSLDEVIRPPICLFIARLPMPVLNDPPVSARADLFSDQLHQLTVPIAASRVQRVVNHLSWSSTNRNAVVLFDRRVISKEYGSTILHSLLHCSQKQGPASLLPDTLLDWLSGEGSWEDIVRS